VVGKGDVSLRDLQAVTTAVGLEFGLASSLFAVSLCFTLVTMYDATGVRYHSG
jgi:acid phosphatase family membrane protein YuiD